VAKTQCECVLAGYCERHGMQKNSAQVKLCQTSVRQFESWDMGEAGATVTADPDLMRLTPRTRTNTKTQAIRTSQRAEKLPCVHRSKEPTGTVRCKSCPNHFVIEPTYSCELHGECVIASTYDKTKGYPDCLTCKDRQPTYIPSPEERASDPPSKKPKPGHPKPNKYKKVWSYGVTTVPSRLNDLLPRTLASLAAAGFDQPRLFIDGAKDLRPYDKLGLEYTNHNPPLRTFGKWFASAWELYVRCPTAHYYAVFQDDFVTYPFLKHYLESFPYPKDGYLNLYTFPEYQQSAPTSNYVGWFKTPQWGLGAVALVFNREVLCKILSQPHMINRPQDLHKGHKSVDGGIVTAANKAGLKEYAHLPSLVQHTGRVSSMKNRPHEQAPSFRGESFDARKLIKERKQWETE